MYKLRMSYFGKRKKMSSRKAGSSRPGKRALAKGYASFKSSKASQGIIGRSPATRGSRTRGVEVKSVDMPIINAGSDQIIKQVSTTATFDLLNGVQEGASFYNRIGRRTHMKSVHVTGQVVPNGSNGAGVSEYLRCMLVYDRQPNGNFPAIADILLDYGNDGTTATTSLSKMNLNNVERFAILRDQRVMIINNADSSQLQANGQSLMGGNQNFINWYVPLKDLETHYKSTTNPAAIGDIATGALYMVTFGNVAVATSAYQLQYNARLRFIDI